MTELKMKEMQLINWFGCSNLNCTRERIHLVAMLAMDEKVKKNLYRVCRFLAREEIAYRYPIMYEMIRRMFSPDDTNPPESYFISCVTFGKSAEFAQKYLHKGMRIVIGGRISTGSYKDKDGKTIHTTDVIVEEHEFAQNKENGAGADLSEKPKIDKDGFMEAPDGEIQFD